MSEPSSPVPPPLPVHLTPPASPQEAVQVTPPLTTTPTPTPTTHTPTLEDDQNPQTLESPNQSQLNLDQVQVQVQDEEDPLNQGMDSSFPILPSSIDLPAPSAQTQIPKSKSVTILLPKNTTLMRIPSSKRKKGKALAKKQQAFEKKYQTLIEKLTPIPFTPSKILDFSKHEPLLRKLGLWDFVNVDFDKTIRVDLIAQLIAAYDPKSRCSYVNEVRIMVNRADLGRAFKLPVKKEKGIEIDSGKVSIDDDSISFIEDFVNNWVLLHEDTWILPNEVMNWMKLIHEGQLEKVDFAGLFWYMVEKELTQGEFLKDCYYASHLQYLIKSQHEEVLFETEPEEDKEEESENVESKGLNIELTLGQDNTNEEEEDELITEKSLDMMNIDEEEEDNIWKMEPCSNNEGQFDNTIETQGLTGNLLQGMEGIDTNPSPQMDFNTGPSFYENMLQGSNKRSWDEYNNNRKISDFDSYMEEMKDIMGKMKMKYEEKENLVEEISNTQQVYQSELHNRDIIINQKNEEILKKDEMIFRLEREIMLMSNLIEGYRKAYKETNKAFIEYRKRVKVVEEDESVYKDVGPTGLMLRKEEEFKMNCLMIEGEVKGKCEEMMKVFEESVNERFKVFDERLVRVGEEVVKLKSEVVVRGGGEVVAQVKEEVVNEGDMEVEDEVVVAN